MTPSETKDKATRAAADLAELLPYLVMAASNGDAYFLGRARQSLCRALAALSDAPEPHSLSPHGE